MNGERILIVAPSWVGDAILSEPLVALLREPFEDPVVDVLAPPWCAAVYSRMRGVRRIIESPLAHGKLDLRRPPHARRGASRQRLHARDRAAQLVEVGAGAVSRAASRTVPATAARCATAS